MRRAEQISRRLKLRHLNVLLAVAEQGSMVKAAERLAVSQPVISKAIADLEHLVGVPLLDRRPHGIEPTPYGLALLKRSASIFDDLRTSVSELETLADPGAGELRIGSTEAPGVTLVPAIIDRLSRRYPRIKFELTPLASEPVSLIDRDLRGRRADVVVGPFTQGAQPDLDVTPLYRDRVHVVASAANPLARRRKITLADLANEPWVLPTEGHPIHSLVLDAFRRDGLPPPQNVVAVTSAPFTSSLVARGRFLGVLGSWFVAFSGLSSQLKLLPVDLSPTPWPTSIATLKGRTLSPVAKLFIDCAREVTKPLVKVDRGRQRR